MTRKADEEASSAFDKNAYDVKVEGCSKGLIIRREETRFENH